MYKALAIGGHGIKRRWLQVDAVGQAGTPLQLCLQDATLQSCFKDAQSAYNIQAC